MVFRRRRPLPWHRQAREVLWPRRGWSRVALYVRHRLGRLPGTPYRIAAGFACGAAISFTPFLGLHFVLAAVGALMLRANLVASAIGTVVGNPWTFPLIWYWIYVLGQTLLGREVSAALPEDLSLGYIFDRPLEILWPMTVGGLPTALAAWVIAYLIMHRIVSGYQQARRIRRVRRKLRRRARERGQAAKDHGAKRDSPEPVAQTAPAREGRGDRDDDAILATRRQH